MNPGKIGIDLGTTDSCCGVFKNGIVQILSYNDYKRTRPSYVYYYPNNEEIAVGNAAQSRSDLNQVVYDSKRFIGRTFDDPEIQDDMKYWPFKVVKGDKGQPLIELKHNKKEVRLSPTDVSIEILKKIKTTADTFIGQDPNLPTEAVITVPAYFNVQQRQNTIKAAEKANLKVIKIINEPSAAAIAYAYQRIDQRSYRNEETVLVYDFGGGEDIDQSLVEYYLKQYKQKTGEDIKPKQQHRLKKACEEVKMALYSSHEANIDCDTLEDEGIDTTLTRCQFECINKEIFNKTMSIVDKVLNNASLKYNDIDNIVVCGGCSVIPRVQELLREKFPRSYICRNINPDEVVAYGACLYANLENMHFDFQNIITHTISTDIEEGGETVLYPLIPRNTPIPYTNVKPYSFANAEDGADYIDLNVFEGEGKYPNDKGVRKLPCQQFDIPKKDVEAASYIIDTVYKVDENGVLTIEVKDRQTGITSIHSIELE